METKAKRRKLTRREQLFIKELRRHVILPMEALTYAKTIEKSKERVAWSGVDEVFSDPTAGVDEEVAFTGLEGIACHVSRQTIAVQWFPVPNRVLGLLRGDRSLHDAVEAHFGGVEGD